MKNAIKGSKTQENGANCNSTNVDISSEKLMDITLHESAMVSNKISTKAPYSNLAKYKMVTTDDTVQDSSKS